MLSTHSRSTFRARLRKTEFTQLHQLTATTSMQSQIPSDADLTTYLYVDASNVYLEGQRLSTLRRSNLSAFSGNLTEVPLDLEWRLDYGRLRELLCGAHCHTGALKAYGSESENAGFWNRIADLGFETTTFERRKYSGERMVDAAIAHAITKDAYTRIDPKSAEIVLVTGDQDFCPVVAGLVRDGFNLCVAFWSHASRELQAVASSFFPLDHYFDFLTLRSPAK
jgi:hypothetical protein